MLSFKVIMQGKPPCAWDRAQEVSQHHQSGGPHPHAANVLHTDKANEQQASSTLRLPPSCVMKDLHIHAAGR